MKPNPAIRDLKLWFATDARDAEYRRIYSRSPKALCWCATGAVNASADVFTPENVMFEAVERLEKAIVDRYPDMERETSFATVWLFNDHDHTNHSMIVQIFEEAIRQ